MTLQRIVDSVGEGYASIVNPPFDETDLETNVRPGFLSIDAT